MISNVFLILQYLNKNYSEVYIDQLPALTDGPNFSISILPYDIVVTPGSKIEFICTLNSDDLRETPKWLGPDGSIVTVNPLGKLRW